MAKLWEIRGLFGNEWALEQTKDELGKQKGFEVVVLDRRNLSVRMAKRDKEGEATVKRIIEIHHGYVESEAPVGRYDSQREAARQKKTKAAEKKSRE